MRHRSFLLALLFFTSVALEAQEWTRFRGPDGSGIGSLKGLPQEISESDYAWSVALNGVGHSSPVLWGEKLFLTIVAEDGSERRLECYEASTGKFLWAWKESLEEHNLHKFNNFASSSPTVDAERVYIVVGSGKRTEAFGIDHSGTEVWKREWSEFTSDHGFAASPILVDGVLIFHTDSLENKKSFVMGLDPATGKTLWEVERITEGEATHTTAYSTPAVLEVDGKRMVVVMQTNDGWKGIDPKSGAILWAFNDNYKQRSVGSIAPGNGLVFATIGSGSQGRGGVALRPKGEGDPEVAYKLGVSDGLGYVPTPLFYDGRLYLWRDDGILSCLDAVTGKSLYKERVGGNFFSSPIVADNKIIGLSREGEVVMVKPGDTFELLGRIKIGEGASATPAIANNRIYFRTDTHLICVSGS